MPAEPAKKLFDIPKLIGEGITSGLSSAVSSTGTYILGHAVNALFGTNFGDDTSSQLAHMAAELENIENTLVAIDTELSSLENELHLQTSILTYDELLNSLSAARSHINVTWQSFASYVRHGSATPTALDNLISEVIGDGEKMQIDLYQVANTLVTDSALMTDRRGLLDVWVNYSLQSMKAGPPSDETVWQWYQYLENLLMKMLQDLHRGMILVVNAAIAQECRKVCRDPSRPGCHDCIMNQPGTAGLDYLVDPYRELLVAVTGAFRQSVNRFVLACYDPMVFAPRPRFVGQDVLDRIMARVDLLVWLTLRQPSSPADPGIMVRRFLRPGQLAGASLTPPGLAPQQGKVLEPQAFFRGGLGMSNWYKVPDFTDDAQTALADFDKSDVQTVEYHWAWPAQPPAGKPLAGSGLFSRVVPRYYDTSTLEPASSRGDGTVLLAAFTDPTGILESPLFTSQKGTDPSEAGWGYNLVKSDGFKSSLLETSHSLEGSPHRMHCQVAVEYGEVDQRMTRQVTYAGKNTTIALVATGSYAATVWPLQGTSETGQPTAANKNGPVQLKLTTYTLDGSDQNDKKDHTATGHIPVDKNGKARGDLADRTHTDVQLRRGRTTVIRLKSYFYHGTTQSQTWKPTVSLAVDVDGLRLAWPQPVPNPDAP
ncbi:MAG TPA: hypothetical protein VFQ45_09615 [Longimicrobium sp.]|nr:hypothetical protein [Longimicrobium sp.]